MFGCDELVAQYERAHDDYKKIMAQSLADRFAEAMAEFAHREIRKSLWGYAPDEALSAGDLLKAPPAALTPVLPALATASWPHRRCGTKGFGPLPATPHSPITPRSARSGR